MLIYLDHALNAIKAKCEAESKPLELADLYAAIMEGAVDRVRPKMMTVVAIMAGLLPIMWGSGTGSEVMRRIAAPMVGGMISSTILTLLVIPATYALVKELPFDETVGLRNYNDRVQVDVNTQCKGMEVYHGMGRTEEFGNAVGSTHACMSRG